MPVSIKYKLSDLARDLGVQNKELIDLYAAKTGETKKHTTPLTQEELDYAFEHFTAKTAVASFDEFFASARTGLAS